MKIKLLSAIVATVSALAISTSTQAAEFNRYEDGTETVCASNSWIIRSATTLRPVGRLAKGECMELSPIGNGTDRVFAFNVLIVRGAKSGQQRLLILDETEVGDYYRFKR